MLESKLDYLTNELKVKKFYLHVHPFVAAFLKKGGLFSQLWKWKWRFGFGLHLVPDQSMELLQYKVKDADHGEVDLKQPIDNHV